MIVHGKAADTENTIAFSIQPHATGGYILYVQFSGAGAGEGSDARVWPTISKAKEIAEATARRLLKGVYVSWEVSN